MLIGLAEPLHLGLQSWERDIPLRNLTQPGNFAKTLKRWLLVATATKDHSLIQPLPFEAKRLALLLLLPTDIAHCSSHSMIGLKGRLSVIDNSGALIAECINVLKVKTKKKSTGFGTVGAFTSVLQQEVVVSGISNGDRARYGGGGDAGV